MNTLPPPKHTYKSVSLDALRGVAALLVAFGHARVMLVTDPRDLHHITLVQKLFYFLASLGPSAVIIFFVLSGFLVGSRVIQDIRDCTWSWRKYIASRVSRIYIVLIPALIIGGMLDLCGSHLLRYAAVYSSPHYAYMLPDSISGNVTPLIAIGNLLCLQEIFVPTLGSNHPLWSLTNEVWYYVMFPLFALAVARRKFGRVIYGAAGLSVLLLLPRTISALFLLWLMGVVVALLPPVRINAWVSGVAGAMLTGWLALHSLKIVDNSFITGAITSLLIYCLLCQSATTVGELPRRVASGLSAVSYSLYLFHTPFVVFLAALFIGGGPKMQPSLAGMAATFGLLVAAIAYSSAMWFFFEKRTPELRRWLSMKLGSGLRCDLR